MKPLDRLWVRQPNRSVRVVLTLFLVLAVMGVGLVWTGIAAAASLPVYLQTYQFLDKFGTHGPGAGQFDYPQLIAFGPNGDLYVADAHNERVQEVTTAGAWVRDFGSGTTPDWGSGNLGFDLPQSVAVSASHVWIVDETWGLAWFDLTGGYQGMSLGPSGSDTFTLPAGAAVDTSGNVFVADGGVNHRIAKYDSSGAYVCQFGGSQINDPFGVVCDTVGGKSYVYVADWLQGKVLRYTQNSATSYAKSATWSQSIMSTEWEPRGIAVDPQHNVYVVDDISGMVLKLNSAGKLLARFGGNGTGDGQFTIAVGVAVDPATGIVYASDRDGSRIETFQLVDLGPKTYAKANLSVTKGKSVSFVYGVAEDVSATATAKIKIKKGSTVKKTINLGSVKCGSWLTKKWTCSLAKGSYKWSVYATDKAGHTQVLIGTKSLTVK